MFSYRRSALLQARRCYFSCSFESLNVDCECPSGLRLANSHPAIKAYKRKAKANLELAISGKSASCVTAGFRCRFRQLQCDHDKQQVIPAATRWNESTVALRRWSKCLVSVRGQSEDMRRLQYYRRYLSMSSFVFSAAKSMHALKRDSL